MIEGIYGVIHEVDYLNYSIWWKDSWYSYRIDFKQKYTEFYRLYSKGIGIGNKIKVNAIVPLNEANFVETINRFEKLMLLQ